MNTYSLGGDGSRWWWTPTGLGAAAAAAVAAILVLPAVAHQAPAVPPERDTTVVVPPTNTERPCFMWRAPRGTGWDGFQPTCPDGRGTSAPLEPEPRPGIPREGLDFGP